MYLNSKNFINILIWISTSIIIFNFFFFVSEKSLVQYSDWLINYQGGFVRRGLIGEFFFKIYQITNIPLNFIIFLFVSSFYIIFSILLIRILEKIKFNFLNYLIIFSPISFLYPVMEQKVSGRKDIIFILSVAILCFFLEKFKFKDQKYLISIIILFTTFSHTGFFLYLPVFFLIFVIVNFKEKFSKIFIELFFISLYSFFLLLIIIFNTTISNESIINICNSIEIFLPNCGNKDYISTLNWTLSYEIEVVENSLNKSNYIPFYLFAFIFTNAPLIYAFYNSKFNENFFLKINPLFIFLIINMITFPIYYIGADYGRYMYLAYLSLVMIYFKSISNKFILVKQKNKLIKGFYTYLIIFLFGFTLTVPHCCNNKFKLVYQKPILKIIEKIKS